MKSIQIRVGEVDVESTDKDPSINDKTSKNIGQNPTITSQTEQKERV